MYAYQDLFQRSVRMIGQTAQDRLQNSHVAVLGLGGVGSHAAEALARAGIGELTLVDKDIVDVSNINRQLVALCSTVGQPKTDVMARRIQDINPHVRIHTYPMFFLTPSDGAQFSPAPEYIIDAIVDVTGKLALAEYARAQNVPMIMCLGTGNKLDPSRFRICDIYRTAVCPLAKVMRHELRRREFASMPVLFSDEPPLTNATPPGSLSYVPPVAGYMLAGYIIRQIMEKEDSHG